jgi:hypothetical protein
MRGGHVFKESPGVVAYRKSCPCCVEWSYWSDRGWGPESESTVNQSFDHQTASSSANRIVIFGGMYLYPPLRLRD